METAVNVKSLGEPSEPESAWGTLSGAVQDCRACGDRSMRILVVEDNPKLAVAMQQGLAAQGYAVDIAERGYDAEELAARRAYDAIILDLMLPDRERSGTLQGAASARGHDPRAHGHVPLGHERQGERSRRRGG